jgi:MFS family permease
MDFRDSIVPDVRNITPHLRYRTNSSFSFFCGAPIGPIFDAYGPRALIFAGSILLLASIFLLGLCSRKFEFHPNSSILYTDSLLEYWHFFIVYSLLNGIGGCLINTPCIASIGHYFLVKRGNATGIAMTSGSIGGIIFPLMLQKLFPTVGFAWATRILGFILLFLLAMANLLVRSRLPRKPLVSMKKVAPDLSTFKDLPFTFVTIGIFLMEWGIFVPLTYITSYATVHGHSAEFGFQILAIMNGGSFFGRLLAGIVADMIGRVNTLIISIAFCIVTCFGLVCNCSLDSHFQARLLALEQMSKRILICYSGYQLATPPQ